MYKLSATETANCDVYQMSASKVTADHGMYQCQPQEITNCYMDQMSADGETFQVSATRSAGDCDIHLM